MTNWKLIYEEGAELDLTDEDVRRIMAFLNNEDTETPTPDDQSSALLTALGQHQADPNKMSRTWWDNLTQYILQSES